LKLFYECPKCGYKHPVPEREFEFTPKETIKLKHTDHETKLNCDEEKLILVDEHYDEID